MLEEWLEADCTASWNLLSAVQSSYVSSDPEKGPVVTSMSVYSVVCVPCCLYTVGADAVSMLYNMVAAYNVLS